MGATLYLKILNFTTPEKSPLHLHCLSPPPPFFGGRSHYVAQAELQLCFSLQSWTDTWQQTPGSVSFSFNVTYSATMDVRIWTFSFLFLLWDWGLNSGLHTCRADTLTLEPNFQFILVWLFWNGILWTISPGWPWTVTHLIPAFQVSRITGMSHQYLAQDTDISEGPFFCLPQTYQTSSVLP
jgi:hypothetical protein